MNLRQDLIPSALIAVIACILLNPPPCRAGTIIEVDANPATIAQGLGGEFQQNVGVSWTMNQAFSAVTIEAAIASANAGDTATAYLTTAAGPGTTTADVVAESTFGLPVFLPLRSAPDFTIFTGLTLSAGTYYLIITTPFDSSEARGWRGTSNAPEVTTAPGVTLNPSLLSADTASDPNFAPDSNFSISPNTYQFAVFSVPEPSSLVLGCLAVLTSAWRFRRLRTAS
jgi:hypothetical protein